ncbi:hypothetical protein ALC56_13721 [Trachymyrmex septentrionalis]|uniref:Uncharacterized protein n=1 Tax=Trachymyrmex septentrionalis TaxID=34720 RepID=A0A195EUP4_9HYME|nr:hypothetical protein ALC56_13721 [Trachymyrmex septentrionalis]
MTDDRGEAWLTGYGRAEGPLGGRNTALCGIRREKRDGALGEEHGTRSSRGREIGIGKNKTGRRQETELKFSDSASTVFNPRGRLVLREDPLNWHKREKLFPAGYSVYNIATELLFLPALLAHSRFLSRSSFVPPRVTSFVSPVQFTLA